MFPAGTPKDIIDLVYRTIAKIVQTKDIKEEFEALGFRPMSSTPEESTVRIKDEIVKWAKVIHDAHIQEQ
jgi:tripartite-type tricarboxylate transporter receptor subunit TctC